LASACGISCSLKAWAFARSAGRTERTPAQAKSQDAVPMFRLIARKRTQPSSDRSDIPPSLSRSAAARRQRATRSLAPRIRHSLYKDRSRGRRGNAPNRDRKIKDPRTAVSKDSVLQRMEKPRQYSCPPFPAARRPRGRRQAPHPKKSPPECPQNAL